MNLNMEAKPVNVVFNFLPILLVKLTACDDVAFNLAASPFLRIAAIDEYDFIDTIAPRDIAATPCNDAENIKLIARFTFAEDID